MNIVITGGDGFIGQMLVRRLLSPAGAEQLGAAPKRITLLDQRIVSNYQDARVQSLPGNITDAALLAKAAEGVDCVFHLASIPGGAAENNFELGMQVNLHATLNLLEALRTQAKCPRVVFASTIAVYGVPMPALIDENTIPEPALSYGAQKLIGEILLADYSRKGFIDGRSVRIPGIVARPPAAAGMMSAFLSDIITGLSSGKHFVCPVAADAPSWWMSRACIVDNLINAAALHPDTARKQRTWQMPVLRLTLGEVVAAIARIYGKEVLERVSYQPNPTLQAQFANYPPLNVPKSLAAGFRTDGDAETLVKRALEGL
jgi:D-erythronate 2-dehydrogenase